MSNRRLTPKEFFEALTKDSMDLVDAFYHRDVVFKDPLVQLNDREEVKTYYRNLYRNVDSISWEFPEEIAGPPHCALLWKMTLTAKNFNGGKPVVVDGVSVFRFDQKEGNVIYHRDYFDMGAFVYEGLPILGGIVRFIKSKMASHKDATHG